MTMETPTALLDQVPGPRLGEAVELFLEDRKAANLAASSLQTYTSKLTTWQTWRAERYGPYLADVSLTELRAFMVYLREEHVPMSDHPCSQPRIGTHLSPATIHSFWRTLRNAWNFWTREGLLSVEQMTVFAAKRLPSPRIPHQIRPIYEDRVLDDLIAAARSGRHPSDCVTQRAERAARDIAILHLLYDTGMRAAELCGLRDGDVNLIEREAKITGKGDKQRWVFWTERAMSTLNDYRALRRGAATGHLFRGVGRLNNGGPMTPDSIRQLLRRLARRAECSLPPTAPVHAWRHTFAHRFLDAGGDGLHLQQLLGHESMTTTQRYVKENPKRLRKVYRRHLDPDGM